MQDIYDVLSRSDGVILATPIYFGGVTGQMKLWLDRLFPYLGIDLSSHLRKKIPLSVIYTQNQPDITLFTGAIDSFEFALSLIGFGIKGRLIAGDLDAGRKPGVFEYPDLIRGAYHLGESLIAE
jgi:multimeric flavodoxin WrbA